MEIVLETEDGAHIRKERAGRLMEFLKWHCRQNGRIARRGFMFRIETEFGNFHSYKDLLTFMQKEDKQSVRATVYMLDTPIGLINARYTRQDIEKLAAGSSRPETL